MKETFNFIYKEEVFKKALDLYENTYVWKEMSKTIAKMLKESKEKIIDKN